MIPFKNYYILPAAREEFREARKWYASRKVTGLSNRFALAVKETIQQILKNPGAYAVRYKNDVLPVQQLFPYAVHFLAENETIIITNLTEKKMQIFLQPTWTCI